SDHYLWIYCVFRYLRFHLGRLFRIMRALLAEKDEGLSMKETIVFCRHPRFKSWLASISKRLPIDEGELRFADENEDLAAALSEIDKLVLIDFAWKSGLEHMLPSATAQVILLGDVQGASAGDVWSMRNLCMERPQIHA